MEDTQQMPDPTLRSPTTTPDWWPDDPLEWALDRWIQLLGIAFLLIGVGFLFKYTYERGLLIPPLRVLCGAGIGGVLGAVGWRIRESRRTLAHVLLGGASATFYITLYAASELYALLPGPVAFAGMMAVTMATFLAAVTQRGVVLANIATIGGYVTPFLLDVPLVADPALEDLGTMIYMCIVLAGSTATFVFKGWRSVQVTSAIAMWGYLGLVTLGASTPLEKGATQMAIVITWLATAVAPVARVYLSKAKNPLFAHVCAIAVPGFALLMSWGLFWEHETALGLVTLAFAALYGAAAFLLRRERSPIRGLGMTHALVSIGMTTLGLLSLLSGPTLGIALLVQAVALCWLGHELRSQPDRTGVAEGFNWLTESRLFGVAGHLLLFWVCLDTVVLFGAEPDGTPFLNPEGLQLLLTAVGLWIVGQTHEPDAVRPGFGWAAHALVLGTVLHQASGMLHGDLVATACWGAYSLGLITLGLTTRNELPQWMGLSALLLTAGKLIFVDMSGTETLWRVLLFMAFGVALLVLNYFAAPRRASEAT